MRIYLIGLPGSGKSTVGRQLSVALNYAFQDLDQDVEALAGKPITNIFASAGENVFRELEQRALRHTFSLENTIIATGGGTPCFFSNLDEMKANGTVVFLNPPVKEIMRRLQARQQQEKRPLMEGIQTADDFKNRFGARFPYYEQAHIIETAITPDIQQLVHQLSS